MSVRGCLLLSCAVVLLLFACKKNNVSHLPPPIYGDTTTGVPEQPAVTYDQKAVHVRINDNVGGYYEALPPSYEQEAEKHFPLLLFLHGGGELGDGGPEQLPMLNKNSLTKRLHEKKFPTSFTVNDESFSFIIISPQFQEWPNVEDIHGVLLHVLDKYRVDTTRIYMSGLSMGGGETWEYAGSQYGRSIAAIVPICGASWADSATARQIAANEVPSWAFHNKDDSVATYYSTTRYARLINAEKPKFPVKVTIWETGGHDAWTLASDPTYREEGKNMYEWMLQYTRRS